MVESSFKKKLFICKSILMVWVSFWCINILGCQELNNVTAVNEHSRMYTMIGVVVCTIVLIMLTSIVQEIGKEFLKKINAPVCEKCPDHDTMKKLVKYIQAVNEFQFKYMRWQGNLVRRLCDRMEMHDIPEEPVLDLEDNAMFQFPSEDKKDVH